MQVNTYDATPLHEVILNPQGDRVFDDGSDFYPTWFEVQPGGFTCGEDWADAEDRAGYTAPVPLVKLREIYASDLVNVTERYPRP